MVDSADPDRIGDSKEELRLMLEAGGRLFFGCKLGG